MTESEPRLNEHLVDRAVFDATRGQVLADWRTKLANTSMTEDQREWFAIGMSWQIGLTPLCAYTVAIHTTDNNPVSVRYTPLADGTFEPNILEIDGRAPTDEERQDEVYLEGAAEASPYSLFDRFPWNRDGIFVSEESESEITFKIPIRSDISSIEADDLGMSLRIAKRLFERLDLSYTVSKVTQGPRSAVLKLSKPFSVLVGIKMNAMNSKTLYQYLEDLDQFVLENRVTKLDGKAFLVHTIDQLEERKYSNFHCLTPLAYRNNAGKNINDTKYEGL